MIPVLRPDGFHGAGHRRAARPGRRSRSFFEGWYVKLVSPDRSTRLALIPGIFLAQDGSGAEAFVQVLDGVTGSTEYHRFDPGEFAARADRFDVRVGANRFSAEGVQVDLPGLSADVRFGPLKPWPVTVREPGAMGWYAWVPTMECYHGVVSFDHALAGWVRVGGSDVPLTGGRGYLEKDWGTAFPRAYIWMQSNHFERPGMSLVASTAIIPWRGSAFRGDLVGLRSPDGRLHRFTTYTRSRTLALEVDDRHVHWVLAGPGSRRLEINAAIGRVTGLLHAPVRTQMHRRVSETLDGTIDVRLSELGSTVLAGTGSCSGVEVHGEIDSLIAAGGR